MTSSRRSPVVVSLSPYVPTAGSLYAGEQFYHHYLGWLGRHFDVTVLAPDTPANRRAASECAVDVALARPFRRSAQKAEDWFRARSRYLVLQQTMRLSADQEALLAGADVVDLQWSEMLAMVPVVRRLAPSATLTALEHDVHHATLRWSRLGREPLARRSLSALAGVAFGRAERKMLNLCDGYFTFKPADVSLLQDRGVRRPGRVLGPWLERPKGPLDDIRDETVLFVAAFDRRPNREAAEWLIDRVWPQVTSAATGARLLLAGAGADDGLQGRGGATVAFTGAVADLDLFYRSARCVVAPIFGGGGLRFKVPQAMLYGLPLVVTPLALEGLEDIPDGAVAARTADPDDFARAVVDLLQRPSSAHDIGATARQWAQSAYSFDRTMTTVTQMWGIDRE